VREVRPAAELPHTVGMIYDTQFHVKAPLMLNLAKCVEAHFRGRPESFRRPVFEIPQRLEAFIECPRNPHFLHELDGDEPDTVCN
jgi:hypothetical protein